MSSTTSEQPPVTVVLLSFNYERYIDEALSGLFAQTYQPLDIIVIDDCSSDRSAEIIEARLAQRGNPPNIRFVRNQQNMGNPIVPSIIGMIRGRFVIILPFYAYFLGGARFINEPLLKYRVHSRNTSLSLLAEKTGGEEQLLAVIRTFTNHLAHAVFFDEELDRVRAESPQRFGVMAD